VPPRNLPAGSDDASAPRRRWTSADEENELIADSPPPHEASVIPLTTVSLLFSWRDEPSRPFATKVEVSSAIAIDLLSLSLSLLRCFASYKLPGGTRYLFFRTIVEVVLYRRI
jgi:hypothetical protein